MRSARPGFLGLALLSLACAHAPSQKGGAAPAELLIPVARSVWRVRADGRAEPLDFRFRTGNPDPAPSPDRRRVAFSRAGNIWLLDLATRDCDELTSYADAPNASGEFTALAPEGWTADSRSLVVRAYVAEEERGEETTLERCAAVHARSESEPPLNPEALGTYVFDARTGAMDRLANPTIYVGARPVGFVETDPGAPPPLSPTGDPDQVFVEAVRGRALVVETVATESSRITALDLRTGASRAATPEGPYEEYRRPSYSPGGIHFAYLRGGASLIVDGRAVLSAAKILRYWWIDDVVVAAIVSRASAPGPNVEIVRVRAP